MGDYDGEMYRTLNYIYSDMTTLRQSIQSLDETMKNVLTEIKGLRNDMQQQRNSPL